MAKFLLRAVRAVGTTVGVGAALGAAAAVGGTVFEKNQILRGVDYQPPPKHFVDGIYGDHYPGPPLIFMVMGDSNGAGIGASSKENTTAVQLAKKIADVKQRKVMLFNLAETGAGAKDVPDQITRGASKLKDYRRENPDVPATPSLIFINVGGNDALDEGVKFDKTRRFYTNIRDRVNDDYCGKISEIPIAIATCPDASSAALMHDKHLIRLAVRKATRMWATEQEKLLLKFNAQYDFEGPFFPFPTFQMCSEAFSKDSSLFSSDRFHPNDRGQEYYADRIGPGIISALDQETTQFPTDNLRNPRVSDWAVAAILSAGNALQRPAVTILGRLRKVGPPTTQPSQL